MTGQQDSIWSAREEMCKTVLREVTRGLKSIFKEVRSCYTERMDHNKRLLFLQNFPTFEQVKQSLLQKRREKIPADAQHMKEANINLNLFNVTGENCMTRFSGVETMKLETADLSKNYLSRRELEKNLGECISTSLGMERRIMKLRLMLKKSNV